MLLDLPGGATARLDAGVLVEVGGVRPEPFGTLPAPDAPAGRGPVDDDAVAERAVVAAWLDAEGSRVGLRDVTNPWAVRWQPPTVFADGARRVGSGPRPSSPPGAVEHARRPGDASAA